MCSVYTYWISTHSHVYYTTRCYILSHVTCVCVCVCVYVCAQVTTIKIEIFADLRSLEFLLNQLSTNKADSPPPPPPPHSTTHANECSSGRRSDDDDDDGGDKTRVSDNSDSDDEEDIDDNGKSEVVECSGEEEAIATVRLQDVMVLRVEKGRDYFLSLSADFCPTREGE
jgi:hypothetical protein